MSNDHSETAGRTQATEAKTDAHSSSRTFPMQHGHRPAASQDIPATLVPPQGWHCLHLFYQVDRAPSRIDLRRTPPARLGRPQAHFETHAPDRSRTAPVLCRSRSQGRLRHRHGRPQPPRLARHSNDNPGLEPRPCASSQLLLLLDHRGLRIRPRRAGIRPNPPRSRKTRPRNQHVQGQGGRLRRTPRPDEPPAPLSRFPSLALPLLLPHEQDAHRRPELVPAPLRTNGPSSCRITVAAV